MLDSFFLCFSFCKGSVRNTWPNGQLMIISYLKNQIYAVFTVLKYCKYFQDGLSIDKLEEQLNVLKANFTEKQSLIEEMMAKCKVDHCHCSDDKTRFFLRPRTMAEGNLK